MGLRFGTNIDLDNSRYIVNLPDPTDPRHAVNKQTLDNAISSLRVGLNWKDNVRVRALGNVNIASPPATIDGITLNVNDRILLVSQTDAKQNGIYIYNGSGQPLTRAFDAATTDALNSAAVIVSEGTTYAGTAWVQKTPNPIIGTDNIIFDTFGSAPPATETTSGIIRIATQSETNAGTVDNAVVTPLKLATYTARIKEYDTIFGDTTNTIYDITHNLGTKKINAQVFLLATEENYECKITRLNNNTVRVELSSPPGNNALQIVIFAAV